MDSALRWVAFGAGVAVSIGTVVAVMKVLIVPRRSWSLVPTTVGRIGYRFFHAIAIRLRTFDAADRLLGFQAPLVIIGILSSLMACFVVGFALLLMPWIDGTLGDAFREAGSSVFTLGFIGTDAPVPTLLDVLAGATGMIFVALTIGYLPAIYSEVKRREALVRQLSGWAGSPSWGPEVLARLSLTGALGTLPNLFSRWDLWCSRVAETHVKYPVLTQFRLPRSGNHFVLALAAVMDTAALDISLRPDADHGPARLLLIQGRECLEEIAYPMRRISDSDSDPFVDRSEFDSAVERLDDAGYPREAGTEAAWPVFSALRAAYAPMVASLAFWLTAVPAPWTGTRHGFEDEPPTLPDHPQTWAEG